ncbi:MAG: hypothetical protein AAF685_12160 [Cyanobacteria bacterium P01_C01_bin.89]
MLSVGGGALAKLVVAHWRKAIESKGKPEHGRVPKRCFSAPFVTYLFFWGDFTGDRPLPPLKIRSLPIGY